MKSPLVSICVPNLNMRPWLEERMETLLAQTLTDWEIIVCDSYSTDGSWEFFQKFKGDPRVRLYQVPREGIYAGWNECLRRAQGRHVYFATSDDTARPELLERLVKPLERLPELQVAVCDFQRIGADGRELEDDVRLAEIRKFLGEWLQVPSIRNGRAEFLIQASLGTTWHTMTSVMFRRTLIDRIGMFRTDCGSYADSDWSLRAQLASDIAYVPGRLATWRFYQGQGSPHRFTPRTGRILLGCLETVLHDPRAGVPESWKQIRDWEKHITASRRAEYLASFHLWRRAAAENPRLFAQGVWDALRSEPGLLRRQVARGFAWSEDFRLDLTRQTEFVLKLFRASWPPQRIEGGW